MYKILKKRVFRDLKENMFRHLALGLLIILGMYIVIGLVGAADTIIRGTARLAEANHVEAVWRIHAIGGRGVAVAGRGRHCPGRAFLPGLPDGRHGAAHFLTEEQD